MQLHQKLFVFDIETIPDTDAIFNLTGSETTDIVALRQELEDYHLEVTKGHNPFPRQPFHKVVAVSFLEAEIHRDGNEEYYVLNDIRSGGEIDTSEADLVNGFFHYLGKIFPRLVTFNGRGFDLPVMKYRAMQHGIAAPWLYNSGDKWNNYSQRYSNDWLIVGVGVNTSSAPDYAIENVTSLTDVGVDSITERKLLEAILKQFNSLYTRWLEEGFSNLRNEWLSKAAFINETITVRTANHEYKGVFKDINKNGELVLELPDGKLRLISTGEVFFAAVAA